MNAGYVYAMINPHMPGLVKIGLTTGHPVDRAFSLRGTGVPGEFEPIAWVAVDDCLTVERHIHSILADSRVPGREFFRVSEEAAVAALKAFGEVHLPPRKPLVPRAALLSEAVPAGRVHTILMSVAESIRRAWRRVTEPRALWKGAAFGGLMMSALVGFLAGQATETGPSTAGLGAGLGAGAAILAMAATEGSRLQRAACVVGLVACLLGLSVIHLIAVAGMFPAAHGWRLALSTVSSIAGPQAIWVGLGAVCHARSRPI